MSASIEYGYNDISELINNYNAQTGTLSSITFISENSQAINVYDWVNLVITSGGFQTVAETSIAASTLNGMARVISKEPYGKGLAEYIRLEFNPAKSMPGLVVPIRGSVTGTITRMSDTSQGYSGNTTAPYPAQAPAFYNNSDAPYPAQAPAFYNNTTVPYPAQAPAFSSNTTAPYPAQARIIPTILIDLAAVMGPESESLFLNFLNNINQSTVNRIESLLTLIFDITDSSGNKLGDAFAYSNVSGVRVYLHEGFRNTYRNILGFMILNHLFLFTVGTRFLEIATNGAITVSSAPSNLQAYYNLCEQINNNTEKIIQFYREIFNRKDELLNNFDSAVNAIPILANILINILYPPPAGAPRPASAPAPAPLTRPPATNTNSRPPATNTNSRPPATNINSRPPATNTNSGAPAPAPLTRPPASPPAPRIISCDNSQIIQNREILSDPNSSNQERSNAARYLEQCESATNTNSRPPATNTNSRPPATNTNSRPPATNTNSGAPAPARGVNINRIIVDFANDTEDNSEIILNMFNNSSLYNQNDIDTFASMLNLIYQINDNSGNTFGDAFDNNNNHEEFRNTYKNLFVFTIMNYLFFFIRGVRFIEEITNGSVTIDSYENEEEKEHIRLSAQMHNNRARILMFYREIFNRRNELLSYYDNTEVSRPIFTNILMRIYNPPGAGAPAPTILYGPQPTIANSPASAPEVVTISSPPPATELDKVRSDLQYLTSLGLTATSNNETMKNTLRRYKEITGSDYFSLAPAPALSPSSGIYITNASSNDYPDYIDYNSNTNRLNSMLFLAYNNTNSINVNDMVNIERGRGGIFLKTDRNRTIRTIDSTLNGTAKVISKSPIPGTSQGIVIRLEFNPPISIPINTSTEGIYYSAWINKINLSELTKIRSDLDKDLKYLFGLGLNPNSGNDTMNDKLAKWKQLTGENYIYNPSGGKYRKKGLSKRKTAKRKRSNKSKTRKY